jgi:hypothetical protein
MVENKWWSVDKVFEDYMVKLSVIAGRMLSWRQRAAERLLQQMDL